MSPAQTQHALPKDIATPLRGYRIMANVVGVLLVVLVLVGVPLANFDGSPMWGVFSSTPELFPDGGQLPIDRPAWGGLPAASKRCAARGLMRSDSRTSIEADPTRGPV